MRNKEKGWVVIKYQMNNSKTLNITLLENNLTLNESVTK